MIFSFKIFIQNLGVTVMGGRGRTIPDYHLAPEKPFSPADVDTYLDTASWSDNRLNMMGQMTFSTPVDNPGLSATKDSLVKEYQRRHGTDPSWGK
jgi:hypothetical protein